MVSFTCNLCGAACEVEDFATEPASCSCGSNVRIRGLIHLVSMELFGCSMVLADFPQLKALRVLGMSDQECYARLLQEKFNYTNTYYDREPRLDFTESHPSLYGAFDFILSADVIEHITPPITHALHEMCLLLKPHGFLGLTIFCTPQGEIHEHFPELHEYRVVPLGQSMVLINRRRDGALEIRDDLVFHGGSGATLEMREFGIPALQSELSASGFRECEFLTNNIPEIGIMFDHDVSQPLIARKDPFVMPKHAAHQLAVEWLQRHKERERAERLAAQVRAASESKWLRLGRMLGLGPRFNGDDL
jgi:hypothetical protein